MTVSTSELPKDRPSIVVQRRIAVPRERVFAAFSDPATIGIWWGPTGFRTTTKVMDFRVGGAWTYMMHGPDGTDYPNYTVYREIVAPERIVYDHGTGPDQPFLFRSTILLQAVEGGTRVVLELVFADFATRDATAMRYGAVKGGEQNLMKLDAFLTGAHALGQRMEGASLILTRWFDAPPATVFAAWTETVQMARWWGPHGMTVSEAICEQQVGGRYRVAITTPDGIAYPMEARILEFAPGHRLVLAADLSEHPASWHEMMAAAIRAAGGGDDASVGPQEMAVGFHGESGGTRLEVALRSRSAAEAGAFVDVGAVAGWTMSFERLDALLMDVQK
jgi:uncharacterized protein YndB with AHSA1/START domain